MDDADYDMLEAKDLFNPYDYMLKRIHVSQSLARLPLGVKTKLQSAGVVEVVALKNGGIGEQVGVHAGMYLLCSNGHMCTGEGADSKPNEQGLQLTFAQRRQMSFDPKVSSSSVLSYNCLPGCEYLVVCLNLITFKLASLNLVSGKSVKACVGVACDRTAIEGQGLRIGDIIVAADYRPVADKESFEALLRKFDGDLIDLTIERSAIVVVPLINVTVPEVPPIAPVSAPSPDDKVDSGGMSPSIYDLDESTEGLGVVEQPDGDPALGVPPEVPTDVKKPVLGSGLARKIIAGKVVSRSTRKSAIPNRNAHGTRVKIDKVVDAAKLFKDNGDSTKN